MNLERCLKSLIIILGKINVILPLNLVIVVKITLFYGFKSHILAKCEALALRFSKFAFTNQKPKPIVSLTPSVTLCGYWLSPSSHPSFSSFFSQ